MTFRQNVITMYTHSNYNIITNKIFLFLRNIITKYILSNYIIITLFFLAQPVQALEFYTPIEEGGLVFGRLNNEESLYIHDTQIQTDSNGFFVFGIHREHPENIHLKLKKHHQAKDIILPVKQRIWPKEIINDLPVDKVILSTEDKERAHQERDLLARLRNTTDYTKIPDTFIRPVPEATRISSSFGSCRILNNLVVSSHSGTDYAAPLDARVLAVADGIVRLAHPDMFYSGKTILIDHGFGLFSSYSHLNHILVQENQSVKQGDIIGFVGSTGRSTGPHLHFTMTWFHIRIDPEQIIHFNFSTLKSRD